MSDRCPCYLHGVPPIEPALCTCECADHAGARLADLATAFDRGAALACDVGDAAFDRNPYRSPR